jgi:single-strand DNA-binding protein
MNSVTLVGFVSRPPKSTPTKSSVVCKFGMGTKDWREGKEEIEWHNIIAWGKLAEICQEYLVNGKQIALQGKIKLNKWNGEDGKSHSIYEILAEKVEFVGSNGAKKKEETEEEGSDFVTPAPVKTKPVKVEETDPSASRRRGRPPGSKNKPKAASIPVDDEEENEDDIILSDEEDDDN